MWGALWGSFVNVVVHRLPLGLSVVRPASRCPGCHEEIRWYDNVPILAWLWLRARCRDCGEPISARYPLVELLAALLALALFEKLVLGAPADGLLFARLAPFLVYFAFAAALLAVTFIDIDVQMVPLAVTWPGAALGVLFSLILDHLTWWESLAGAVLGAGSLYLVNEAYRRVRGQSGFGGGDLSLLAMIGAFCGVGSLLFVILAASLQGTLAAVAFGLLRRFGVRVGLKSAEGLDDEEEDGEWRPMEDAGDDVAVLRAAVAFVPYLSLAALEWILVGEWIWGWYMGLMSGLLGA